jgi:hypothetical protein
LPVSKRVVSCWPGAPARCVGGVPS